MLGYIKAKSKSYKKVSGRWKKRRADIYAFVYGTIQNSNCNGNQYVEGPPGFGKKKKVKSKFKAGMIIQAYTNAVHSDHTHSQIGSFRYDLKLP